MANDNKQNSNKKKKKNQYTIYWIYAGIALAIIGVQLFMSSGKTSEIQSQGTFFELMEDGYAQNVKLVRNEFRVDFKLTDSGVEAIKSSSFDEEGISISDRTKLTNAVNAKGSAFGKKTNPSFSFKIADPGKFKEDFDATNAKRKSTGESKVDDYIIDDEINYFGQIFQFLIPILIIVVIWLFIMKRMSGGAGGGPGGQIFNIGKSKAQVYEKGKTTNVSFKDVAGLEGAKEEVEEIVDFLKNPKKYTELGAKIPKGALLVGPPGTGKTLLAKAVAGEAKVPFFSLSGSDFVEMFVGVGASRVRDLFKQAKEKSPAIIFIDEIDAIGRARGKSNSMGSNDERENTLNQLLTEMDGFGTNSGVIILAATNRADVLDKALMRAGRFDRQIYVDMPDLNERKEIFQVHLKPLKLEKEMDIEFLSKQTPGFSGADIANLCNEAALIAARKKKTHVEKQDFLDAVDRIIGGLEKKNKIITKKEKESIAFHEAGHATISWLLQYAHPLVKVTIVPRGQSLGAAWYLPEERSITTTEQILDDMCSALGGRAAEQLIFGKISTGALSDLEKVTKQAYAMVSMYGLNERVGNISFYDSQGQNSFTKPYSDVTARIIDEEVSLMIEAQYKRALDTLEANKDKLTALANKLLEKEVIFKEDLEEIFGKRQWQAEILAEKIKEEVIDENNDKSIEGKILDATTELIPEVDGVEEATSESSSNIADSTAEIKPNVEKNKSVDSESNDK